MVKQILISFIIFIILPAWNANGQPVRLNATLERESIQIGEQTHLSLQIIHEPGAQVIFPLFQDTITSSIEIIRRNEREITDAGHEIIISESYLITSFDTGYHKISPISFPVDVNGEKDTLYTQSLFLHVGKPEVDLQANFRDIVPPVNTPFIIQEALPYAGVGLAGLALLLLASWLVYRLLRKKKVSEKEKPRLPPYVIALDELKRLQLEKAWEKQDVKEFYTELSAIVRTYLEDQFDVPAMESTTSEIIPVFKEAYGQKSDILPKLEELLQLSDLVKFAKEMPFALTNMQNIEKAIQFVELTIPETNEFNVES